MGKGGGVGETPARLGVPAVVHTGEPAEVSRPLDYENALRILPGMATRGFPGS